MPLLRVNKFTKKNLFQVRVIKSTMTIEEEFTAISGAKLINSPPGRRVQVEDFTVCLRFNFQRLYSVMRALIRRSRIMEIKDWLDQPGVSSGTKCCLPSDEIKKTRNVLEILYNTCDS